MAMYVEAHGSGPDTLLLLHGMGATGAVWRRVVGELAGLGPRRTLVVDLPGHGRSDPMPQYDFAAFAAAVAAGVEVDGPVVVAGHSFGGFLGLLLASGNYGLDVVAAVATGVKVTWTTDELERVAAFAAKPPSWFATYDEAEARYRRVAGLTEDVTDDGADLARGVVDVDGRFRLSHDPASAAVGAPDMPAALAAAACPVLLSRGEGDPMVSLAELRALAPTATDLEGGGHNIQVQQPRRFAEHVLDFAARPGT
jgi:pimeloyl-ACP methyl ester carboxylesterase